MREIKFRAWLKETKEMIPVYQIDFDNGIINSESAWRTESEYILEQYTGLIDKNGNKIFEGDIVKAIYDYGPAGEIERIVEVVFDPFGTNLQDWIFKEDGYLPEVIGNIHDNPELLT